MALDDRDRTFEKALARHLRYVASAGEEHASLNSISLPCPDPEILAAYHDDSLSPDERALWKPHVLTCDRCQLILEHLSTPLDVSVNAPAAVLSEEQATAVSESAGAVPMAPAVAKPRPAPRRNYFWWLVPTGALAAAGLVAFLVLRPAKPLSAPRSASFEVARNQEPPSAEPSKASPPPSKAAPPPPSAVPAAKEQDAFVADGAATSSRSADNKDLREETQPAQNVPELSKKTTARPNLLNETGKREASNAAAASGAGVRNEKQDQLKQQVAELDAEMKRQGVAQQVAPSAVGGQAGYLADNNSVVPAARAKAAAAKPPAAPVPAETRDDAASVTPSSAADSVEVSNQLQSSLKMRAAVLKNPNVFAAPGGKVLWRLGAAGSIERSTDTGKDWTAQASGVNTDLLAGSAPSEKVCWIVGAGGTILRTTDGGAHWTKLNPPAPGELAGIVAIDALHARIRFAPDSGTGLPPSYQTSDGGVTWTVATKD